MRLSAVVQGLALTGAGVAVLWIPASEATLRPTVERMPDTIQVVVTNTCDRHASWCPDIGEHLEIRVYGVSLPPAESSQSWLSRLLLLDPPDAPAAEEVRPPTAWEIASTLVEEQRSGAMPTVALSVASASAAGQRHWVNEARMTALTHSPGAGWGDEGHALGGWLDSQRQEQFARWRDATPASVVQDVDEQAQRWLPRLNYAVMRVVSPVADAISRWMGRER